MKNNEEFRNAVFEKAAAYEKQRKIKRQKTLRITLSVCVCLAVFIAVGTVPLGLVLGNMDVANSKTPPNTTAPDHIENMQAATTTATTRATTCTTDATTQTTEAYTYTTTLAYTYSTTATAATTCTSTTAEILTTTATELSTTGPLFPEQLLEDYYHNGVMTLHLATGYGYSDDCHIANVDAVFAYSDLSEAEAKYFDEAYFEGNALIRIKYTLGDIGSRLNYAGMQAEGGKITVFLDLDKAQSEGKEKCITWEMLISIPADVAKDAAIVADVKEK